MLRNMLPRADDLAPMAVLDAKGRPIELATLWRDRTAVLAFVRHFGCVHCREHVEQLQASLDEVHAAGAELYVIGNGAPHFIEGFRETTGFTGQVFTDPSLAVYRAAHLRRGVRTMLGVGAALRTAGALRRGYLPQRTQGDQFQQGGVLVIARDGTVVWQHVSEGPGDNAEPAAVVRAVRAT